MDTPKCFYCGSDLHWDSDANAIDVFNECDYDEYACVSYYTCPKCGRSYEVIDPTKEEKETNYKDYWDD